MCICKHTQRHCTHHVWDGEEIDVHSAKRMYYLEQVS